MKRICLLGLALIMLLGCGEDREIFRTEKDENTLIITSKKLKSVDNTLYHLITEDSVVVRDKNFDRKFDIGGDWVEFTFNKQRIKIKGDGDMKYTTSGVKLTNIKASHIVTMLDSAKQQAEIYFHQAVNF